MYKKYSIHTIDQLDYAMENSLLCKVTHYNYRYRKRVYQTIADIRDETFSSFRYLFNPEDMSNEAVSERICNLCTKYEILYPTSKIEELPEDLFPPADAEKVPQFLIDSEKSTLDHRKWLKEKGHTELL